jgi:exopolysaccharide production protein ExoQ
VSSVALDAPRTKAFSTTLLRWPVVLPILLMVVSDYDWRQRSATESLAGRPDFAVLLEIGIYGLAGLFLINLYAQQPKRVRATPAIVALWGFGVTMTVSAALAPYPTMALVRGAQLLVMCLVASMLASTATPKDVIDTLHVFVLVVVASVAFGVLFPFPAVSHLSADRFTWLFVHPTLSGVYMALAIVICIGLSLRPSDQVPWPRAVYIGMAIVVGIALSANHTRGSIAGAVVGSLVIAVVSSSPRKRAGLILAVIAGVVLIVLVAGPGLMTYLSRGESQESLTELNSRTSLWTEAWRFFSERPVSGWGLGATRGLFLDSLNLGGGHNAFVNVLVDGGIAGLVWWVATLVCALAATRRLARISDWRPEMPIMAGILAALLVNSITVEGLGAVANVSSWWLVIIVGWSAAGVLSGATRAHPPSSRGLGRPGGRERERSLEA